MSVTKQQVIAKEAKALPVRSDLGAARGARGLPGNHSLIRKQAAEEILESEPSSETVQYLSAVMGHTLQRKCACGTGQGGECEACKNPEAGVLQREAIHPSSVSSHPAAAPPIVNEVLRSPGKPLDSDTRAFMEPRFKRNFSDVRVHTDAKAGKSALAVNALAYTVGRNIVFGPNGYEPQSARGKRLLGHELAHVLQQNFRCPPAPKLRISRDRDSHESQAEAVAGSVAEIRTDQLPSSKPHLSPAAPDILLRTPGKNAAESWQAVAGPVQVDPKKPERLPIAAKVRDLFLETTSGQRLINNLWYIFCDGRPRACKSRISVSLVDVVPVNIADTSGYFTPEFPDQPQYDVYVRYELPLTAEERARIVGIGKYPGGSSRNQIHFEYIESESKMAATLFHELLHVWFIHQPGHPTYPTGHRDQLQGEIEPVFFEELRLMSADLDQMEKRAIQAAGSPREVETPPANVELPAATRPTSRPSLFGGELSGQLGASGKTGLTGKRVFSGSLAADLVLGKINALHIGVRGVYLTPDHLLAGGALGYRRLQSDQGDVVSPTVENPLFFDLEAGVLVEIPTGDAARLTNHLAVMGSASLGQESGRQGARSFWKIGGFVLISDKRETAWGVTVGAGRRF